MENIELKKYTLYTPEFLENTLLKIPSKEECYLVGNDKTLKGSDIDYIHNAVVRTAELTNTINVIRDYLNEYPDKVDARTKKSGYTPLMVLCEHFDGSTYETLSVLIESGADLNAVDEKGQSVLIHCLNRIEELYSGIDYNCKLRYKYESLLRILLDKGANPDYKYKGKSVYQRYLYFCDKQNIFRVKDDNDVLEMFIEKCSDPKIIFKKNISTFDTLTKSSLIEYLNKNICRIENDNVSELIDQIIEIIKNK